LPDIGDSTDVNSSATKISFKTVISYGSTLLNSKLSHWWSEKSMESKNRAHENARDKYRDARSSSTTKKAVKDKLQLRASQCLKDYEKSKLTYADSADELSNSRGDWVKIVGSRALHNLVKKRRELGIPLPFTFSLTKGSKYAIAKYHIKTAGWEETVKGDPKHYPSHPGSWKSKLKFGDYVVFTGGITLQVQSGDVLLDAFQETIRRDEGDAKAKKREEREMENGIKAEKKMLKEKEKAEKMQRKNKKSKEAVQGNDDEDAESDTSEESVTFEDFLMEEVEVS